MTTAGQQIVSNANSNNNQNVFGSILYNVKAYGAKGDVVTDDTTKVQNTINAAIAAGAKLVFFPPGTYKVSALTNSDQVYLVGDNATFTGGYIGTISEFGLAVNPNNVLTRTTATNQDRFRNYVRTPSVENSVVLIGDSITEGTRSTDFVNDGYAGIIRKAFETEYGVKNFGFESFFIGSGVTKCHTVTTSGFTVNFDGNYYGGVRASSSVSGNYIEVSFVGKDAKLVYGGRADGGVLNVILDSVLVGTIDTKTLGTIPNATVSLPVVVSAWGQHTIRLTKVDNSPTDLSGMIYYDNGQIVSPILQNIGRSSITLSEIPNNILDSYCNTGTVVLALGVNDQFFGSDINTFKTKLNYVANKMRINKGTLIFADFMFSLPYSDPYKKAIRDTALNYPEFDLIDFAQIWFSDLTINKFAGLLDSDGIHPTVAGHEFIANTLMRHMGLPYTKRTAKFVPDPAWVNLPLSAGFGSFSSFQTVQYRLYPDGKVKLRGATGKSGAIASSTVIGTLPVGRRPLNNRIFAVTSNSLYGEVTVRASDGAIVTDIAGQDWFSLENIVFDID